jgi:hypothetical protein
MSFAHQAGSEFCGQSYISVHAYYEGRSLNKVPLVVNIE